MKTPYGAWRASYVHGRWTVLSGPTSMVIMEPAPEDASDFIGRLWTQLIDCASVSDIVRTLADHGLDKLPNLAAFFWDDQRLHCLLRGSLRVFDANDDSELLSGAGTVTWREVILASRSIYLPLDETASSGEALELPLVVGAVQAASVYLDLRSEPQTATEAEPASVVWGGVELSAPDQPAGPEPSATPGQPASPDQPAALGQSAVPERSAGPGQPAPGFTPPPVVPAAPVPAAPIPAAPIPAAPVPPTGLPAASAPVFALPPVQPESPMPTRGGFGAPPAESEPLAPSRAAGVENSVSLYDSTFGERLIVPPVFPDDPEPEPEPSPQDQAAEIAVQEMIRGTLRHTDPIVPATPEPSPAASEPSPVAEEPAAFEPEAAPALFETAAEPAVVGEPERRLPEPPVASPVVAREPTQVLGERPPYAPGQEPGAERGELAGAAGQPLGPSGTTGPWGAAGFAAAQPGPQAAPVARQQPETAPAVLLTAAGERIALTSPVVIGRSPAAQAGEQALRVLSPNHDISRTHLRIADDNGRILVTDMNSTNGTIVIFPDGQSTHLANGETIEVAIGGAVDLGDGQTISVLAP